MAGRLPRVTGATGSVDTAGEGGFWGVAIDLPTSYTVSTAPTAVDRLYTIQFVLSFRAVVGKIVFEVSASEADKFCGVGLYDVNQNLVLETGAVSTAAAEIKDIDLAAAVTLEPGVYYLGWIQTSTSTLRMRGFSGNANVGAILTKNNAGRSSLGTGAAGLGGALPATIPAGSTSSGAGFVAAYFER